MVYSTSSLKNHLFINGIDPAKLPWNVFELVPAAGLGALACN
jgi:hypothetical protein